MEYVVVLVLALGVVYGLSPEDTAKLSKQMIEIAGRCQKETGAIGEDIQMIVQKKIPTRKEGKCMLFCINKKMNFQDSKGKNNIKDIYAWLEEIKTMDEDLAHKFKQVADKCLPTIDDSGDPCEVAGVMFDCTMKVAKEIGISVLA